VRVLRQSTYFGLTIKWLGKYYNIIIMTYISPNTFIDDATRKTWVYYIRQKSDAFDTFKKWKALIENETGKILKCLRSDNGGEYCSKEFDDYYSYHGIRREKTVP
jgi:hypothetical protein